MYPHDDQVYDTIADLAGPPQGGKPEGWLLASFSPDRWPCTGCYCLLTQQAWFLAIGSRFANNRVPRRGPFFEEYHGPLGDGLGLISIAVALYLHFRFFWSQSRRLVRYYEIGQLAAILLFIAALGWWIFEFAQKFF